MGWQGGGSRGAVGGGRYQTGWMMREESGEAGRHGVRGGRESTKQSHVRPFTPSTEDSSTDSWCPQRGRGRQQKGLMAWGSGSGGPPTGESGERRKHPWSNPRPAPKESAGVDQPREAALKERDAIPTAFLTCNHWHTFFMRNGISFGIAVRR